jgi:hypothetical protein
MISVCVRVPYAIVMYVTEMSMYEWVVQDLLGACNDVMTMLLALAASVCVMG